VRTTAAIADAVKRLQREGRIVEHRPAATPVAPIAERVSEREFMAAVVALAKRLGWKHYHTTDSRKSVAGFPDLVLIRGEVLIVAELKVQNGRLAAEQLTWLEAFASAGVRTFVWRPADWAEIVKTLN